jgi:RNA polymerase sigma-70 factor, ECF subfamily
MDVSSLSDTERLLTQARTGESDSLGALLELYRSHLQALAGVQLHGRLRARVSASDVVQETFLRASEHFDDFRGTTEQELAAWLRTILRRSLLHIVQRQVSAQKRTIHKEVALPQRELRGLAGPFLSPMDLVSPGSSPSAALARREVADHVNERLARLPRPFREVLVLRNLEGLSFPEVARRMRRTPGAVRILWLRALERLRQQFSDEGLE